MGGTGTWNLAAEYPTLFAPVAPLSGSARLNADAIKKLDTLPVWAFVGSADTIVPLILRNRLSKNWKKPAEQPKSQYSMELTIFQYHL